MLPLHSWLVADLNHSMAPLSAPGRYFSLTLFLVRYFQGLFRDSLLGPSLRKSPWPGCFRLYSGWSLWLIPQPLSTHPLASCSWGYFTPEGREPTSRQWEIHLWLGKAPRVQANRSPVSTTKASRHLVSPISWGQYSISRVSSCRGHMPSTLGLRGPGMVQLTWVDLLWYSA